MAAGKHILIYLSVAVFAAFESLAADGVGLLLERTPDERPELLILGTAHFAGPGLDVFNPEVEDVLSERRQAEITRVVEHLRAFDPQYVAVEFPRAAAPALDRRYEDYRDGRYELNESEMDQLGLRLAALLDLDRVHAVDWNGNPPGEAVAYDWMRYGEEHAPERLGALLDPATHEAAYVSLHEQSVGAWLRELNEPELLVAAHRVYFDFALLGDDEHQPGANWVGAWYARNLRIFGNLVRIGAQADQRIVVIYGLGHAYLLRQFAEESGAFAVVDVSDVLPEE